MRGVGDKQPNGGGGREGWRVHGRGGRWWLGRDERGWRGQLLGELTGYYCVKIPSPTQKMAGGFRRGGGGPG